MKRYLAIGAAVVVLAAAGWSAFWWAGRGEVGRAVDDGVARLGQQGWTIDWRDREIGGFPFGYTVRLTGLTATQAASGMTLRLPGAVAETEGAERVLIRLPETFAVELSVPAPTAAPDVAPETVEATGQAANLVLGLTPDGAIEITGDRLAWTVEEPEIGRRITQAIEGLAAMTTPDRPGARYRLQAVRMTAEVELAEPGGPPSTATAMLADVLVEGASSVGSREALVEMLYAGAPGQAQGSLRTGPTEVSVVSAGDGVAPGRLDWRAEALGGDAILASGRIELHGEARGNVWELSSPDPAAPVQGRFSVADARAIYAMPMAPAERPDDMAIALSLTDATADDAFWARIDPGGELPRNPASLTVDLTGSARVTERIDQLRPGAKPPFEISHIVFRELSAEALGATAHATGEVDILQPLGVPLGTVQAGLTGIEALVRTLARAGVIPPETVEMAQAIMAVYLRPAGGADAWNAEIEFTRAGALVNGLPVQ